MKKKPVRPGLSRKMKVFSSFSAWEKEASQTNKLTRVVANFARSAAPQLETVVKWGQGCFLKRGTPVMYIHTEPDHVHLGFYNGVKLKDPNKLLVGKGKYVRHIKIVTKKDLESKDADYFIKQVV